MPSANIITTFGVPGVDIQSSITRSATAGLPPQEVPLPAGVAGSLTTRTDDDTGVVTATGHGLSTADIVDVYWTGGIRYGMEVSGVAGDLVTVGTDADHVGLGDVLPAQDTAVVIVEQVVIELEFDSDNLVAIAAVCDQRAHLEFHDSATVPPTAAILGQELATAGEAWSYIAGMGFADPFGSDVIEQIRASNGTVTAAVLKIGGLYNSTA